MSQVLSRQEAYKIINLYEAYILADSLVQAQQFTITKQAEEIDTLKTTVNSQADLIIGLNLVVANLDETREKELEKGERYKDLWRQERKKKIFFGIGGTLVGVGLGVILNSIIN